MLPGSTRSAVRQAGLEPGHSWSRLSSKRASPNQAKLKMCLSQTRPSLNWANALPGLVRHSTERMQCSSRSGLPCNGVLVWFRLSPVLAPLPLSFSSYSVNKWKTMYRRSTNLTSRWTVPLMKKPPILRGIYEGDICRPLSNIFKEYLYTFFPPY